MRKLLFGLLALTLALGGTFAQDKKEDPKKPDETIIDGTHQLSPLYLLIVAKLSS